MRISSKRDGELSTAAIATKGCSQEDKEVEYLEGSVCHHKEGLVFTNTFEEEVVVLDSIQALSILIVWPSTDLRVLLYRVPALSWTSSK